MPSASNRANIMDALGARLQKITSANGYPHTIKKVLWDEIPLGMSLEPTDLPAILILGDQDLGKHEHQVLDMGWKLELQLVLPKVKDSVVHEHIRSICKCLWCDHPTAEIMTGFRFHPLVTWLELLSISSDLNMIEANRLCSIDLVIHYRAKPFDL